MRRERVRWNSRLVLNICAIVVAVLALTALLMIDRGWSNFQVNLVVGTALLFSTPLIANAFVEAYQVARGFYD